MAGSTTPSKEKAVALSAARLVSLPYVEAEVRHTSRAPHTAFADPAAAPVKARPRESIELRTLSFFDGEEGTATQRA
jgi:hypothetical protein